MPLARRTIAKQPRDTSARPTRALARPAEAAFTLIELLVVLAILVLLLAILSPSTKFAYRTGQKITCLKQLGEITRAAQSYWIDHDGYLVRWKNPSTSFSYSDALMEHVGTDEIFCCPAEKIRTNNACNGKRLDYGINHYGNGYANGDPRQKRYYYSLCNSDGKMRFNHVANADAIYFADAETSSSPEDIGAGSRKTFEWPIKWSFQAYAHDRHLLGYNSAKLDASAEWFPEDPPTNEKWFIAKH